VPVWDVETGAGLRRLTGHTNLIFSVAFSPDGKRALSGSGDRTVRLWDVETGKQLQCFPGHKGHVACVAFSPDARKILSGSKDQSVHLSDTETGKCGYSGLAKTSSLKRLKIWTSSTSKMMYSTSPSR
jgi:WD40 repeat protein